MRFPMDLLTEVQRELEMVIKALEGAKAEMDAAVAAEREACVKIVAVELAEWNQGGEYYANVTEACNNITVAIRARSEDVTKNEKARPSTTVGSYMASAAAEAESLRPPARSALAGT